MKMKKRGRKKSRKTKKRIKSKKSHSHRLKHHGKLLILLTSKLILIFISFLIGMYIGSLFADPPILIMIAFIVGIGLYLLSVLHVIRWLEI
jgi:F0F1-type ATP synthase assembly protein I